MNRLGKLTCAVVCLTGGCDCDDESSLEVRSGQVALAINHESALDDHDAAGIVEGSRSLAWWGPGWTHTLVVSGLVPGHNTQWMVLSHFAHREGAGTLPTSSIQLVPAVSSKESQVVATNSDGQVVYALSVVPKEGLSWYTIRSEADVQVSVSGEFE